MAAAVVSRLRLANPDLDLVGFGGPALSACGLKPLMEMKRTAVNGLWDVLKHGPLLLRLLRLAKGSLRSMHPDLVLLVDYPGLNLRLAPLARKLGYPVCYLAPPQTWAYRDAGRRFKRVLYALSGCMVHVLFPFEKKRFDDEIISSRGEILKPQSVTVGHFFVLKDDGAKAKAKASEDENEKEKRDASMESKKILTLCPGSRLSVIKRNLPIWLANLETWKKSGLPQARLEREKIQLQILVPIHLESEMQSWLRRFQQGRFLSSVQFRVDKERALTDTSWAVAFPGTLTLELALRRIPTLSLALVDPLTLFVGSHVLASRRLALPNLLLQRDIFPEWVGTVNQFTFEKFDLLLESLFRWNHPWEGVVDELENKIGHGDGAKILAAECQKVLNFSARPTKNPGKVKLLPTL